VTYRYKYKPYIPLNIIDIFGHIFSIINNLSKMENYVIVTDEVGGRIINENGLTLIQNVTGNLFSIF